MDNLNYTVMVGGEGALTHPVASAFVQKNIDGKYIEFEPYDGAGYTYNLRDTVIENQTRYATILSDVYELSSKLGNLVATSIELDHGGYTTNLNDAVLTAYYGTQQIQHTGGYSICGVNYYSMLSGDSGNLEIDHNYGSLNGAFACVSADIYTLSSKKLDAETMTRYSYIYI